MSSVDGFDCIIPSAESDRKQLKIMIDEAVACMIRTDGEREHKKEVLAAIKEQFKIDTSILNQVIQMRHKQSFGVAQAKREATASLYTTLYGSEEGIASEE